MRTSLTKEPWRATEKAKGLAQRHRWSKNGTDGYNLIWRYDVIEQCVARMQACGAWHLE